MHDAFLSYARLDGRTFALRLVDALARRNRGVWLDKETLLPGVEFSPELRRAIDASDAFLIVVTERSMSTDSVCRVELEHALSRGKRILPVIPAAWGAVPLPASTPASVRQLNVTYVSDADSFEHDVDQVVTGLDLDLPWIREHTRLLLRATEWAGHDRNPDWLLRGDDLIEAEAWLGKVPSRPQPVSSTPVGPPTANAARSEVVPIDLHRELIVASRARRDAEHESQVSERFGAQARATFDRNPIATPLAARLALESLSRVPAPQAYGVLADCVQLMPAPLARVPHQSAVTVVAAGPSHLVASCDASGVVRVSGATTGSQLWEQNHGAEITSAEFSSDGHRLVVGDVAGHVVVHDAASGGLLASFDHHERISSSCLSTDGRFVLTTVGFGVGPGVRGASIVRVGDIATGNFLAEIPHDNLANALFHPVVRLPEDEPLIVSTAHEGRFRLFDVRGKELGGGPAGDGPEDLPCHMALDPVRPWVALVGMAGKARVLDLASGPVMASDVGTNHGAVAFSRGGRFLAALAGDGTVLVWEIDGWTVVARVPARNVYGVAFGPDEETIAVFGYDGDARIWRVAPLREVARFGEVRSVRFAFSPDGRIAVLAHDGQRCAWIVSLADDPTWTPHDRGTPQTLTVDSATGAVAVGGERPDPTTQWVNASHPRPGFIGSANALLGEATTVEMSREITVVARRTGRPELVCVDRESVMVRSLENEAANETHVVAGGIVKPFISSDGMHVALSDAHGGCWRWSAGMPSPQRLPGAEAMTSVVVSDTGRRVAGRTRDGRALVVWDADEGRPPFHIALDGADHWAQFGRTLVLSRDGRLVAAAVDNRVEIFEVESGRLLGRITHQWPPIWVIFDAAATHLVSASASSVGDTAAVGDLRAWQPATDRQLLEVTLDSPARTLAITADGAYLACGSQSGDIALWDLANGASLGRLPQADRIRSFSIHAVAFSPDGRWLYSVSGGRVRRHLWRPSDLISEVARRITDEPSPERWEQASGGEPRRGPRSPWPPPGEPPVV